METVRTVQIMSQVTHLRPAVHVVCIKAISLTKRVFGGFACIVLLCGFTIVCCNLPLEEVFDNPDRRHRVENQTRYRTEQYRRPQLTRLMHLEDSTIAEAK